MRGPHNYDGTRLGMSRYVRNQQDMRGFYMRGPHLMGLDMV